MALEALCEAPLGKFLTSIAALVPAKPTVTWAKAPFAQLLAQIKHSAALEKLAVGLPLGAAS